MTAYLGRVVRAVLPTVSSSSAGGFWNPVMAQYYQQAGTWPPGGGNDPYFPYVTALLNGDGTNGAQNNTFLDGSANAYTITRNGNTTQGSFDPYVGPGNWGNYFNGSTDYLTLPSGTGFSLGTSDFTIEAWVYPTARVTNSAYVISQSSYGVGSDYAFWITNAGLLQFYMTTGGANIVTSAGTIPLNTWTHIAVSRSGTSFKIFINGAVDGTLTSSVSITNSYLPATIGNSANNTGSVYFPGYISNLRVVKGAAVYTAAFTAPTKPLVATTQTILLTCNSNGFIDQSAANYTITRNGSAQVSKFSPFTLYQTTPASYSGYFDGTGDYLSIPQNAVFSFGTSDFTIEGWVYIAGNSSTDGGGNRIANIASTMRATTPTGFQFYINGNASTTGTGIIFTNWVSGTVYTITGTATVTQSAWHHVAVVRSGTTTTIYLDGTSIGSGTLGNQTINPIDGLWVGANNNASYLQYLNGSISNLRITKGQALYTSTFTPSTSPLTTTSQGATAANVSLLTCQSTTFIDNSTNALAITANGNATPKAANPFTDTVTGPTPYSTTTYGGSAYFDGTGDFLSNATAAVANFGTGDFTWESWIYAPTWPNVASASILFEAAASNGAFQVYRDGSGASSPNRLAYGIYGGTGNTILASASVPVAQWFHLAISRASGSTKCFVNGALVATVSDSNNYSVSGVNIGARSDGSNAYTGYLSNNRIIKGTAVYTGPFVPPAAPVTAITNTQLLVNATNGGITDAAAIADYETVANAQVSTSVVKYGTGSIAFDGTGDYLVPWNSTAWAFGTGNWTIECWVYFNSVASTQYVFDTRANATSTSGVALNLSSTAFPVITVNNVTLFTSSTAIAATTWTHVALVKSSGTITLYLNGTKPVTGSGASSTSLTDQYLTIGTSIGNRDATATNHMNGYIDDFRITNGYARYTTNFTAPGGPFPNF